MKKVSIIIPTYNAATYLQKALDSIEQQRYPSCEIIVIDDGSTDRTADIIKQSSMPIRYEYQERRGPAAARNRGLMMATGTYISFLDADDIWPDDKLAKQIAYLQQNSQKDLVIGKVQYVRAALEEISSPCYGVNLGCGLYRKTLFETIGLFDESLPQSEDVDWFMRLREHGLTPGYIPDVTLLYRIHSANISMDQKRRHHYLLRALNASMKRKRQKNPLVSVIMIVKNGERYLDMAIKSVLNQSYSPFEIILIDGHSSDCTAEIAHKYPQIRYILQDKMGIADAYNQGIQAAKGEYIAFLSSDDQWTSDKLQQQISYMQEHRDIQYTVALITFFHDADASIPKCFRKELLQGQHIGRIMETLVTRKSLFQQVGYLDTTYPIGEDIDWFSRCHDLDIPMAIIPNVLLHKRVHEDNESLTNKQNNPSILKALTASINRKRHKKTHDSC